MKLTHLILDVLFSPLRGDVSGEMLCEFHLDTWVFSPPPVSLKLGAAARSSRGFLLSCCFTNGHTETLIRRLGSGCSVKDTEMPFLSSRKPS